MKMESTYVTKSVLMIALASFTVPAFAAESFTKTFLEQTKFVPGIYDSVKDDLCPEGTVEVDDAATGAVAIIVGEKTVVEAVGPGSDVRLDGDRDACKYKRLSEPLRAGYVAWDKTEKCKGYPAFRWKGRIETTADGFTMTIERFRDKTSLGTEVCTYKRQDAH